MERRKRRRKRSRLTLSDEEYKKLCKQVMERDNWKCIMPFCRKREGLHCHHVIYRSQGGDDASWNLCTVCNDCHEAVHDRYVVIVTKDDVLNMDTKQYQILFTTEWRPGMKKCQKQKRKRNQLQK